MKKVKHLKSEQLRFDQLKMVSTVNKILRGINFVKNNSMGLVSDDLLNQNNGFDGMLGADLYYVGHDALVEVENYLLKRTEINLYKRTETSKKGQNLCHIFQTTRWNNNQYRGYNAPEDSLITLETPNVMKQHEKVQRTTVKTKNGLLDVYHTAQESPFHFINYLYFVINESIRNAGTETGDGDGTGKILDFMTKGR